MGTVVDLGDRILWIIKNRGFKTYRGLAKATNGGVSHNYLSSLVRKKRGGRGLGEDTARAIAEAAGVDLHWLMTGEGTPLTGVVATSPSTQAVLKDLTNDEIAKLGHAAFDFTMWNFKPGELKSRNPFGWREAADLVRASNPNLPGWAIEAASRMANELHVEKATVELVKNLAEIALKYTGEDWRKEFQRIDDIKMQFREERGQIKKLLSAIEEVRARSDNGDREAQRKAEMEIKALTERASLLLGEIENPDEFPEIKSGRSR